MICDNCNIYDLGCLPSCGSAATSIVIPDAGNYKAVFEINNVIFKVTFVTENEDDVMILLMSTFPINRQIIFYIIDALNASVTITIDAIEYTHFSLTAKVSQLADSDSGIPSEAWQETIIGDGGDTYTTTRLIGANDFIQVQRMGLVLLEDDTLSQTNSYKLLSGSIVLDTDLLNDEYIHIIKF